jgi:hypothetical protein
MAFWWMVDKNSESPDYKKMIRCVDDAGKSASGELGAEHCWLEVPEGISPSNAKVVENEDGELELVDSLERNSPSWEAMRAERNAKLAACDWTQLVDAPLSESQKAAWAAYRQALRDLPEDSLSVEAIVWPAQP